MYKNYSALRVSAFVFSALLLLGKFSSNANFTFYSFEFFNCKRTQCFSIIKKIMIFCFVFPGKTSSALKTTEVHCIHVNEFMNEFDICTF